VDHVIFFRNFRSQIVTEISRGFATNFPCRDIFVRIGCASWCVETRLSRSKGRKLYVVCFLFDALARSPGVCWRPSSRAFRRLKETNRKSSCTHRMLQYIVEKPSKGLRLVPSQYVDILITSLAQTRTAGCTTNIFLVTLADWSRLHFEYS